MRSYIALFLALVAGAVVGWALRSWRGGPHPIEVDVDPPLEKDEYERRLEYNDRRYHEAMAQYDKLVPWAAAGGLVASLTLVASFARFAPQWTRIVLAAAWLALVASLVCSILSQYFSTRIQVWAKSYLKSRQHPPDASASPAVVAEWRRRTNDFERRSAQNGQRTKLLNVWGGLLLVVGLLVLGGFAILAVPFGGERGLPPNPALEPAAPVQR